MKKSILTAMFTVAILSTAWSQQNVISDTMNVIKLDHVYTVFITTKLEETVKFYEQYFGFTKVFESNFFVLLQSAGDSKFNIAFMDEKHPTTPPDPRAFNGNGSFITLEVSDAQTVYELLKSRKLSIAYPLKDEPWGQRRFGVLDPNNLWVDVVEQIEPQQGYWDQYMKKQ